MVMERTLLYKIKDRIKREAVSVGALFALAVGGVQLGRIIFLKDKKKNGKLTRTERKL